MSRMWIGRPATMVPVKGYSEVTTTRTLVNRIDTDPLTGVRRTSFYGPPRSMREMRCTWRAEGEQLGMIEGLLTLSMLGGSLVGPATPLTVIPAGAEHINVMPPRTSLLLDTYGAVYSPMMVDSGGHGIIWPGGTSVTTPTFVRQDIPFPWGGEVVNISCVLEDDSYLRIWWGGGRAGQFGVTTVEGPGKGAGVHRREAFVLVPKACTLYGVQLSGTGTCASMVLGREKKPWTVGETLMGGIVDDYEVKPLYRGGNKNISEITCTIKETGNGS